MNFFSNLQPATADPLMRVMRAFAVDARPRKVNLGVGIYYDAEGKIPVPKAVKIAEERLKLRQLSWPYLLAEGLAELREGAARLAFGDRLRGVSERISVTQTLGGTGAIRLGAELIKLLAPETQVAISRPSWPNHRAIFSAVGLPVSEYAYYDPLANGVAFDATLVDIARLPAGSVVVLHGCCHNPTGSDLTSEQWAELGNLLSRRRLVPFIDMAYQGFGTGFEADAEPVRQLADQVGSLFLAMSFSKSFSLYGERVGALCVVTNSAREADLAGQQTRVITRALHSNPPSHGALLVSQIIGDPDLRSDWLAELETMRQRINDMRQQLVERLHRGNHPRDFSFLLDQRGLFSYSGLTTAQITRLREEFAIHAVDDGRLCMAALNVGNVDTVADAIRLVSMVA